MTRLVAATPQLDIPAWVIVVVLAIVFAAFAAGAALVVFGFRLASRAAAGDDRARDRWLGVMIAEAAVGLLWAGGRGFPVAAALVVLQVGTYVVVRRRTAPALGADRPPSGADPPAVGPDRDPEGPPDPGHAGGAP
jgi:hypothetical protein